MNTYKKQLKYILKIIISVVAVIYFSFENFSGGSLCIWAAIIIAVFRLERKVGEISQKDTRVKMFAALYAFLTVCGYLGNYDIFGNTLAIKALFIFFGFYFIICNAINYILQWLEKWVVSVRGAKVTWSNKKVFWVCFALIFVELFVFYLNEYPGTLCVDQPSQFAQVVSGEYNNINPFISTFFVMIFVKLALFLGGDYILGVGLYTLFQIVFYSFVTAYTISIVAKHRKSIFATLATLLFFMFMPYNVMFAISMWKDSIFGFFFLWMNIYIYDYLKSEVEKRTTIRKVAIVVLITLTGLCRNVSWASLIVAGIAFLLIELLTKQRKNKMSFLFLVGAFISIFIQLIIYPLCGIMNADVGYGTSIPLQLVGNVIVNEIDYDLYLTAEENTYLEILFDLEKLKAEYQPSLADNTWWSLDYNMYSTHKDIYYSILMKLGKQYPYRYFNEIIIMTRCFWHPEWTTFLWDYRIYENPWGIERQSIILPGHNLLHLFELVWRGRAYSILDAGMNFWIILFSFFCCLKYKNREALYITFPMFLMYGALILLAPVALFRYTYQVAICLPLIFISIKETVERSVDAEQSISNNSSV